MCEVEREMTAGFTMRAISAWSVGSHSSKTCTDKKSRSWSRNSIGAVVVREHALSLRPTLRELGVSPRTVAESVAGPAWTQHRSRSRARTRSARSAFPAARS